MAFVLDKVSEDTFYENMLLGLTKILEKHFRFKNVSLRRNGACSISDITSWEQFNSVKLPEDLKSFYLASNGFKLSWNYMFNTQEVLPIGSLRINSLSDLTLCENKIQAAPSDKKTKTDKYLRLTSDTRVLKLSIIDDESFVGLVYNTVKSFPNIFLIDENFHAYFLANSFCQYLRMAIIHMGLPYWQHCFTTTGVPTWAEQIFNIVAPHLPTAMPVPLETEEESSNNNSNKLLNLNTLDTTIFKCKLRESRKSIETFAHKKKH